MQEICLFDVSIMIVNFSFYSTSNSKCFSSLSPFMASFIQPT